MKDNNDFYGDFIVNGNTNKNYPDTFKYDKSDNSNIYADGNVYNNSGLVKWSENSNVYVAPRILAIKNFIQSFSGKNKVQQSPQLPQYHRNFSQNNINQDDYWKTKIQHTKPVKKDRKITEALFKVSGIGLIALSIVGIIGQLF